MHHRRKLNNVKLRSNILEVLIYLSEELENICCRNIIDWNFRRKILDQVCLVSFFEGCLV